MAILNLSLILSAVDRMSPVIRGAVSALGSLRDTAAAAARLKAIGDGMTSFGTKAMAAGGAAGAAMLPAVKAFSDLEDATTRAEMAFMGVGGVVTPIFDKIAAQATDLGGKLPGTTRDFMQIAAALKAAGLEASTIAEGGLEATSYLKVLIGNIAPETAAELTASFKNGLGIAEKDFMQFVDMVQRNKFAFGVDPQEFSYMAKYVGAIGAQLGIAGLEGTKPLIALSGMLAQSGIKGEQLGTSLRGLITELPGLDEKIGKKGLGEELEKAGVRLQFFKNGKFMGLENLIGQLDKLTVFDDQKKLQILTDLFGKETASTLATIVGKGIEGYNQAVDRLAGQATLQQRVDRLLETFASKWEAAMGGVTNMLAATGKVFGDDLKRLADTIGAAADKVQGWIEANPQLARTIGLAVAATAALTFGVGAMSLTVGLAAKGLAPLVTGVGLLARGLSAAVLGFRSLTVAMLANPIGLIVLAIAGAAVLVYKYWDPIKGFFAGLWNGLREGAAPLAPLFDSIAAVGGPAFDRLGRVISVTVDLVGRLWDWVGRLLDPVQDVGGAAEAMGVRWGRAIGGMVTTLMGLPQAVADLATRLVASGAALIDNLWTGIASRADALKEKFKGVLQGVRDMLPFSPAKTGPLSDIHRLRLVETIAGSVREGPLTDRLAAVARAGVIALAPIAAAQVSPSLAGPADQVARAALQMPAVDRAAAVRQAAFRPAPDFGAVEAAAARQGRAGSPQAGAASINITLNVNVAAGAGGAEGTGQAVAAAVRDQMPQILDVIRAEARRAAMTRY